MARASLRLPAKRFTVFQAFSCSVHVKEKLGEGTNWGVASIEREQRCSSRIAERRRGRGKAEIQQGGRQEWSSVCSIRLHGHSGALAGESGLPFDAWNLV
ncbi:hypothetical protein EJ110_NYTH35220 [Nymphaea thermarum]|nr:hypothetical protein EJ110_NYTH35220 [Nymphaea thermarum]